MELTIVSIAEQKKYSIEWIELNTPTGNYVIQQGHAPTILQVSADQEVIFSLKSGAIETIKSGAVFAHVTREAVTLLING